MSYVSFEYIFKLHWATLNSPPMMKLDDGPVCRVRCLNSNGLFALLLQPRTFQTRLWISNLLSLGMVLKVSRRFPRSLSSHIRKLHASVPEKTWIKPQFSKLFFLFQAFLYAASIISFNFSHLLLNFGMEFEIKQQQGKNGSHLLPSLRILFLLGLLCFLRWACSLLFQLFGDTSSPFCVKSKILPWRTTFCFFHIEKNFSSASRRSFLLFLVSSESSSHDLNFWCSYSNKGWTVS